MKFLKTRYKNKKQKKQKNRKKKFQEQSPKLRVGGTEAFCLLYSARDEGANDSQPHTAPHTSATASAQGLYYMGRGSWIPADQWQNGDGSRLPWPPPGGGHSGRQTPANCDGWIWGSVAGRGGRKSRWIPGDPEAHHVPGKWSQGKPGRWYVGWRRHEVRVAAWKRST